MLFLDTSYVIALSHKLDPFHVRAIELADRITLTRESCLLHVGILLEIGDGFARRDRRAKGEQFLDRFCREEGYEVADLTEVVVTEAIELYRSRPDKTWGLTDCISFGLMTRYKIVAALTADVHFQQAGFQALLLES